MSEEAADDRTIGLVGPAVTDDIGSAGTDDVGTGMPDRADAGVPDCAEGDRADAGAAKPARDSHDGAAVDVAAVSAACRGAGAEPVVGDVDSVLAASPDAVVAVGEGAVRAVALATHDVPILPVEAGRGLRSVPSEAVEEAVATVLAGEATLESHPVLAVLDDAGTCCRALFDVMVVTAEPAHISEFRVTHEDEVVARFRADGVVAAPPAGTPAYARAAGSPVIPRGPSVCSVVPIAPFATTIDDWVLPIEAIGIEVLREDAAVDLIVDGQRVCEVGIDTPLALAVDATVTCARVPASRSPFAPSGH